MFLNQYSEQVLYYCLRHKYVSINSLALLFPENTNREQLRRKLHKMVQAKLLKRFKIFSEKKVVDMVYTLDVTGINVLKETVDISKNDYEYHEFLKQSYKHRCVLADFDIQLRDRKGVTWYSESESIHQYGDTYAEIIRPDAALLINDTTIFIEYEHTSRPKELIKKIKRYDEYLLYDSHLVHPNIKMKGIFFLFVIVDTIQRKQNCQTIIEQLEQQQFKVQVLTIDELKQQLKIENKK